QMIDSYEETVETASEEQNQKARLSFITVLIMTIVLFILGTIGSLALSKKIVKPIELMTKNVKEISGKNFDFEMTEDYRTGDEIEVLAEAFTELNNRTKKYISEITTITAEKERIGTELSLANKIQSSMLPNVFPPFPERDEFDIYAMMIPAKEVGGDFYDFFLIDDDHLGLVIADVSGKGIPAALFMMMSKILMNDYTMMGNSPKEVLEKVNDIICSKNEQEMFVTVWLGILTISEGILVASNAGHEYPIFKRNGEPYELIKDKHGFVIGGMEGMPYKEYDIQMNKGDVLFLYTDGVAEATNINNELYGTERLVDALNETKSDNPKEILRHVKDSVDVFVGKAPQFDDLTMMCIEIR
ncbi:MAG: SpoIIE family protein phosphatase, partial [Lachnospiraceae bacterium]|nr:SpoIIE family protein phosphatase [Lachnospiraceae bacterium]